MERRKRVSVRTHIQTSLSIHICIQTVICVSISRQVSHLVLVEVGRQRPPLRQVLGVQAMMVAGADLPHPHSLAIPTTGPTMADVEASTKLNPSPSTARARHPPTQSVLSLVASWVVSLHAPTPTSWTLTPSIWLNCRQK